MITSTTVLGVGGVAASTSGSTVYVDASNTGPEDGSQASPYNTIQEGVDDAGTGDTVLVAAGTYVESVRISKPLTVEARGAATLRPGSQTGFEIRNSRDVTVAGFTIEGFQYPITVVGGYRVTIANNTIANATVGGIQMTNAFSNTVTDNAISGTPGQGVLLSDVDTSLVAGNSIDGGRIAGIDVSGGSALNRFSGNDVRNPGGDGIRLDGAHRSRIEGNSVDGADVGLNVTGTRYSRFTGNVVVNSDDYGLVLAGGSVGNVLYDNAFVNDHNVPTTGNANQAWSIHSTDGPNVIGGPTIGGNYWSTPAGTGFSDTATDADHDGFADIDFIYHGVVDRAPLVRTNTNSPPTAVVVAPPIAEEGETIQLDATRSTDPDGTIVAYDWDLDDDGQFDDATGETVTTAFVDDGPYTVALRVTDDADATDTAAATVTVSNVPPTIIVLDQDLETEVARAVEGEPVSLNATFTDPGTADTHTATIDWGDGTVESVAVAQGAGSGSLSPVHTYATGGVYTVALTVADDDDGATTVTHSVTVAHVVAMDVKPGNGDETDPIRPTGKAPVPVAIYTTDGFDAATVDVSSLRLGAPVTVDAGDGATPAHHGHLEDVDGDGDLDLVVHFAGDTGLETGDDAVELIGTTSDSVSLVGTDAVRIVGGNDVRSGGNGSSGNRGNGTGR